MNERELAERFSKDIDRIIQDNKAKITPAGPDREEYMKTIELARLLAETDFSDECKITRDLRQRLLDKIKVLGGRQIESPELDEDDLENVAGGIEPHHGHQPDE
ncbi:hypothetical protein SAMN05660649_00807 [Desulfotomaculum arcticum]|uniref:Uncharacterized protein n=1 Tax=Desulfotruncus arcticus DSM 17038 TaxID=1121424 RepID=A0A1I2PCH7_9FIRM|nr:hypothetical protein [Desulfotruncus arcticus]SFG13213.1 hypothetical protein SAMN05660649_00807 [Desulfotomaculum arcticum] [Desulfotruncus arcticus DSM 17038]